MNIPITNILKWRKPKATFSDGHSRYIFMPRDDMMNETLYFNHRIYHYFTREVDGNKEGIDIEYEDFDVGIDKNFHKQTKNIIVCDE